MGSAYVARAFLVPDAAMTGAVTAVTVQDKDPVRIVLYLRSHSLARARFAVILLAVVSVCPRVGLVSCAIRARREKREIESSVRAMRRAGWWWLYRSSSGTHELVSLLVSACARVRESTVAMGGNPQLCEK